MASCDALPNDSDKKLEAVGRVTVSVPLFTPVEPNKDPEKLLTYGDMLQETNIRKLIETPSIGQSRLSAELVRASFQATLAESGITAAELSDAELAELSDQVDEKLAGLLGSSGGTFRLPPGQLFSLIAAYKTQMVNLEEYYNLPNIKNYVGDDKGAWGWLPYRVHITTALDSAWYTQHHGYDAIVDITLAEDKPEDLKILYVVPGQQAQATQELDAALRRVETLLSASAQLREANLAGEIQNVQAAVEHLEGVRANITTMVSYPAENKISVRFRPKIAPVAQGRGHDLTPEPIVLMAVVLGRKYVNSTGKSVFGSLGVVDFYIPEFLSMIERPTKKNLRRTIPMKAERPKPPKLTRQVRYR